MTTRSTAVTMSLIASQIEAASSLLKFAADDMAELISLETSIFSSELQTIVRNLQAQASTLDGNAAFLMRVDLVADDDEDGENQAPWLAQQG